MGENGQVEMIGSREQNQSFVKIDAQVGIWIHLANLRLRRAGKE